MEDQLLLENNLQDLPSQDVASLGESSYLLHDIFHLFQNDHHHYHHPYDHHFPIHDSLASRPKRFVVTHSMIEQSRFNVALLVLFIICIFLINLFFIVVILWSRSLRSSSKHLLILSVAFADLLQGLLILPLITDLGTRRGSDDFDCNTFQVARLLADFLIPSITTLGVLALNIDYILRLTCNAYSEGISRAFILCTLFVTPWVLSIVLLVPIYVVGVQQVSLYNIFENCHVVFIGGYARALLVLSYILYGFLLLIFTLVVAVVYLVKREQLGLDVTGERVHAPFDICLASFIVVLFYTPIFLFTLLTTEGYLGCSGETECRTLNWSYTLSLWLMFTKSWVVPMAWLFGRDTRKGIKDIFTFC